MRGSNCMLMARRGINGSKICVTFNTFDEVVLEMGQTPVRGGRMMISAEHIVVLLLKVFPATILLCDCVVTVDDHVK